VTGTSFSASAGGALIGVLRDHRPGLAVFSLGRSESAVRNAVPRAAPGS